MQQNTAITPAAAAVGASLVEAILAVLADPKAAASAAKSISDARMLTEVEVKKADEARAAIAGAEKTRVELGAWQVELERESARQDRIKRELNDAYAVHTTNVERLAESVKLHDEDVKQYDEAAKQLEAQKKEHATEWKKLLDGQAQLKKDEAAILRREQTLQGAAAIISGKSAVG